MAGRSNQPHYADEFTKGIQLRNEKGLTLPAKLELVDAQENEATTINEGKYHQVKRMFAALEIKLSTYTVSIGQIELCES